MDPPRIQGDYIGQDALDKRKGRPIFGERRKSGERWLVSNSGTILQAPILIPRRCGWHGSAKRRGVNCSGGPFFWDPSLRRRAGTTRPSISIRPRAGTCGGSLGGFSGGENRRTHNREAAH